MELLLPELGLIIWTTLAFLIVLWLLKKFAWKPIIESLDKREQTISDSLNTAEKVKAEMANLKRENEELLVKAREERAEMLKEAREIKDQIITDAKEQAKTEAAKIMAETNQAIENQKMAALTDVKNQIGNMVIQVAETVIRRQLDNKREQEEYIKRLADDLTRPVEN